MSTTMDPTAVNDPSPPDDAKPRGVADREDVFPLDPVPFERYMLADDRPSYPMTFVVYADLEGTPDREALDTAFADALRRHPMLTARLKRHGLRRRWTQTDDPLPTLHWQAPGSEPKVQAGDSIDLTDQAGIAGEVQVHEGATSMRLLFHHAASDGIGAMRFLGDLLAFYGRRMASESERPTLLPVQAGNLAYRGMFDVRVPGPVSRWDVIKSTLTEGWKVVSRRPLVVSTNQRPPASQHAPRHQIVTTTLPEDAYQAYLARAVELGVTANDLLLRDMFLTVNAWNQQQQPAKARGWLRINMPTTLRGKRDSRMPATNVLGYALVTHHTDECQDAAKLLREIAVETEAIRTWSLGALFVEAMRIADRVPGLLKIGSRCSRRFSTLVLSNVGDPVRRFRGRFPRVGKEIRAGNLTVKSIYGSPPTRPGTRVALAMFTYADRLVISLNADPRWFDAARAEGFLAAFENRLRESAGMPQSVEASANS